MKKISFKLLQLIEEKTSRGEKFVRPSRDTFNDMESDFHIIIDDIFYEVNVEKNDSFIWFEFDYGQPNPIDNKLTNIKTGAKKENLRTLEEAELTNQLFALYDFEKELLYFSNLNKEKVFTNMLKEKLEKDFIIKRFYKQKEEFISILKEVDEISFTDAKNLFNQDTKRRQALIDLTGTNAPEKFTLSSHYSKASQLKHFIRELFDSRTRNELNELVIKGTDDNNFEFIYNVETFIQKIIINVTRNDKGTFDSGKVKSKLISMLYNER